MLFDFDVVPSVTGVAHTRARLMNGSGEVGSALTGLCDANDIVVRENESSPKAAEK